MTGLDRLGLATTASGVVSIAVIAIGGPAKYRVAFVALAAVVGLNLVRFRRR